MENTYVVLFFVDVVIFLHFIDEEGIEDLFFVE